MARARRRSTVVEVMKSSFDGEREIQKGRRCSGRASDLDVLAIIGVVERVVGDDAVVHGAAMFDQDQPALGVIRCS